VPDTSLNFHHLRYFWLVAREGSVTRAAAKLRVTQPTVSEQLRLLQETLGEDLFRRDGRKVALTDVGRTVLRFADEIFSLGDDLIGTVRGRPTGKPMRLAVGVAESVPKAIAYRILEPSLSEPGLRIVCEEDTTDRLVRQLQSHTLDVVISDEPSLSATSELLGESGVSVFGVPKLARAAKRGFPKSLQDAPMLLPMPGTTLRREIDQWLEERGIVPQIVGEFEDPALMTAFASAGKGLFLAPDAIEEATVGLVRAARLRPLRQRFYLLTVQRRIGHPLVARLAGTARERLFPK
jgi:LysR family transcriptional activator of nhaA